MERKTPLLVNASRWRPASPQSIVLTLKRYWEGSFGGKVVGILGLPSQPSEADLELQGENTVR